MKILNIYDLKQNDGFKDCFLAVKVTKLGNMYVLGSRREYQAILDFMEKIPKEENTKYLIVSMRSVKKIAK